MGWPSSAGGWVFVALAVVMLAVAAWQVVQIVRWPEGRELMRRLDDERLRGNEPVVQDVTKLECSDG